MHTFVFGVTGGVGRLAAQKLLERGDTVSGLVRRPDQQEELTNQGIHAKVGDLVALSAQDLAKLMTGSDSIIFSAGAGGSADPTTIDYLGVVKAIAAASAAGIARFGLVSVFPEAWRERNLGAGFDHYIEAKKAADIALSQSTLDWVILRPSVLLDEPGKGTVALGPAEVHESISRADVAATLVALLADPAIGRQILEVNNGGVPIAQAVEDSRLLPR